MNGKVWSDGVKGKVVISEAWSGDGEGNVSTVAGGVWTSRRGQPGDGEVWIGDGGGGEDADR